MPHNIAIAALVRGGKLLLAHRHPQRRWYPDCWDLVGGHIEPGESPETAVHRECREEIGVEITTMRRVEVDLVDPNHVPHAFLVTRWIGEPSNVEPVEHDALDWFEVAALADLRLADPSYGEWLPWLVDQATSEGCS